MRSLAEDLKALAESEEVRRLLDDIQKEGRLSQIAHSGELFDLLMEESLAMRIEEVSIGRDMLKEIEFHGPFLLVLYINHYLQDQFIRQYIIGGLTVLDLLDEKDEKSNSLRTLTVIEKRSRKGCLFARENGVVYHEVKEKRYAISVTAPKFIARYIHSLVLTHGEEINEFFKYLTNVIANQINEDTAKNSANTPAGDSLSQRVFNFFSRKG